MVSLSQLTMTGCQWDSMHQHADPEAGQMNEVIIFSTATLQRVELVKQQQKLLSESYLTKTLLRCVFVKLILGVQNLKVY